MAELWRADRVTKRHKAVFDQYNPNPNPYVKASWNPVFGGFPPNWEETRNSEQKDQEFTVGVVYLIFCLTGNTLDQLGLIFRGHRPVLGLVTNDYLSKYSSSV